jgi:hypothetical protein
VIPIHTCQTIGKCGKNDECEGGWCCYSQDIVAAEPVNKEVKLFPTVENHTFVILQKDLSVLRMKTLIFKLVKN